MPSMRSAAIPVVAGIQPDGTLRRVKFPLVVARALVEGHAGGVLKEEPVRAVAAIIAMGGTFHAGALVQAQTWAGAPFLLALLNCLVHHISRAQCCKQGRGRE